MSHLYIWLFYFCVVAVFTVNGEECTENAIKKCLIIDNNQNLEGRAYLTDVCRKHKEEFDKCVKPFISSCTNVGPAFSKTYIKIHNRTINYVCGEAFETYFNTAECVDNADSHSQCIEYMTITENNNRTVNEELPRYTEEECRAVKQDLLCTKTVNKKACGEDAANVQDILNRISYHETGKVRGCDIPDPLPGANAGSTCRVCWKDVSLLWWVISMACLITIF